MANGVSVIICCFNSALRLPETLKYLALQIVPPEIPWEIILIDNASTDETSAIALNEWNKYDLPNVAFTVLTESKPGKNFAFKRGSYSAAHDFVLTCDDDNWLHPNYIAQASKIMTANTNVGVLGGCGIFCPEKPVRAEIKTHKTAFVNGSQTWAATEHWVYGAGSVYRKHILLEFYKAGWLQITSGRTGSKLICGEDVEICFMFFLNGYEIAANNQMLFNHFVPLKRQSMDYILSLTYWQAYSYVLLTGYIMLLDNDNNPIGTKLNEQFIATLKALTVISGKLLLQKILKKQPVSFQQKQALNMHNGIFRALVNNRGKIIRHFEHLKALCHQPQ